MFLHCIFRLPLLIALFMASFGIAKAEARASLSCQKLFSDDLAIPKEGSAVDLAKARQLEDSKKRWARLTSALEDFDATVSNRLAFRVEKIPKEPNRVQREKLRTLLGRAVWKDIKSTGNKRYSLVRDEILRDAEINELGENVLNEISLAENASLPVETRLKVAVVKALLLMKKWRGPLDGWEESRLQDLVGDWRFSIKLANRLNSDPSFTELQNFTTVELNARLDQLIARRRDLEMHSEQFLSKIPGNARIAIQDIAALLYSNDSKHDIVDRISDKADALGNEFYEVARTAKNMPWDPERPAHMSDSNHDWAIDKLNKAYLEGNSKTLLPPAMQKELEAIEKQISPIAELLRLARGR